MSSSSRSLCFDETRCRWQQYACCRPWVFLTYSGPLPQLNIVETALPCLGDIVLVAEQPICPYRRLGHTLRSKRVSRGHTYLPCVADIGMYVDTYGSLRRWVVTSAKRILSQQSGPCEHHFGPSFRRRMRVSSSCKGPRTSLVQCCTMVHHSQCCTSICNTVCIPAAFFVALRQQTCLSLENLRLPDSLLTLIPVIAQISSTAWHDGLQLSAGVASSCRGTTSTSVKKQATSSSRQ